MQPRSIPAQAQAPLSPEEARALEYGKEIYKVKANCQFCHKWDASGDQGYGGIALSLRKTALTPEQFAEVVKCGRPGTGMPYHDQFAYTDKRCYGVTREELGKDMPPLGESLQPREIDAVVEISLRQSGRTRAGDLRGLRRFLGPGHAPVRADEEVIALATRTHGVLRGVHRCGAGRMPPATGAGEGPIPAKSAA